MRKILNFKSFLNESFDASVILFEKYIEFLAEDAVALTQVSTKVGWDKIKAGFEQTSDPENRKTLAKQGRKIRSAPLLGAAGSNPKLAKEQGTIPDFVTKSLSLSPADESGRINTCSCATEECRAACLNKAGRGAMTTTQKGRLKKTDFMIDNPHHFMSMLKDEISTHGRSAESAGKRAAVRLNVVSDIPYEILHPQIFTEHPNVQFYDYTKIARRVLNTDGTPRKLPDNYHLTLSSTGIHKESNWGDVRQHLSNGGVAAMVFAVPSGRGKKPGGALPTHVVDGSTGKRWRVIDADIHDHRHLDHAYNDAQPGEGLIAGLRIKGGKKLLAKAGNFAVRIPEGESVVTVPDHSKDDTD